MTGARVLLLAAGRGRRAGGPKAWRDFAGKPLLQEHLEFFGRRLGAESVSASIQARWEERCRALSPSTTWVAADPDAAPLNSLQKLIAASPEARSFILHVDMPVFDFGVYEELWAADGDAVVPVFDGRRGHPVLLSARALAQVSALDARKDRLDVWLRGHGALDVPVSTDLIFRNHNEAAW